MQGQKVHGVAPASQHPSSLRNVLQTPACHARWEYGRISIHHAYNFSIPKQVAGHGGFFAFSVTNDTATFDHYRPDYLERLTFTPQIDKFGNSLSLPEQGDTPYNLDSVLVEYHRLGAMNMEEARQIQLEFLKYQVLNPDHDFITFYKIFAGKDISDEIDFVAMGPPMEDFAEFIREYILEDEDDIEAWLYSGDGLHPEWIEEFLVQYPEFKN